ncbi:unnamed protein product [Caenorhabditis auriculariae]|uniref:Glutamate--cysteine ligase n=1 Tax=Caenorhabditis auriculariae TaxID=2777116 RepID=A0A8S1HWQ7_9PELO|nr:unnamed protein product [Caenorhabditis auriculariae]
MIEPTVSTEFCATDQQMERQTSWQFRAYVYFHSLIAIATFILSIFAVRVLVYRSIFPASTRVLLFISLFYCNFHECVFGYIEISALVRSYAYSDSPCQILFKQSECFPVNQTLMFAYAGVIGIQMALSLDRTRFDVKLRYENRETMLTAQAVCIISLVQFFLMMGNSTSMLVLRQYRQDLPNTLYTNIVTWIYTVPYTVMCLPLFIILFTSYVGKTRRIAIKNITEIRITQDEHMGLLTNGSPLSWDEMVPYIDYIKKHGISQFINLYHKLKSRQGDCLKWGDEIEYTIVKFDHENKKVRVSCRAEEVLTRLLAAEEVNAMVGASNGSLWRPEFGAFMIEGTPGQPYGGLLACFNVVEANMRERRKAVQRLLKEDESIMSISFPSLGVHDFTHPSSIPASKCTGSIGNSLFWPELAVFNGHPRYNNFVRNIEGRRGRKITINVPIFKDINTPSPYIEDLSMHSERPEDYKDAKQDHIFLDHMGFGTSCCCLQITFQAVNVNEARWLYDQLTPFTPILLALSAATPIFRSKLADVDSRWGVISESVDDRTLEELGLEPLKNSKWIIEKSKLFLQRYDSTNCYIYPCSTAYNDIPLNYDEEIYQQLIDGDIDEALAKHVAHMFIRDPHQVFRERLEQDDEKDSEHFETIQSSTWMNMRFKPPPPDVSEIGWRVEFRPTEIQLTDFENAAYCCFVVLLTRVIISFRLTYLLPISMVSENMKRAQKRDAVLSQKFFFRKDLATCSSAPDSLDETAECGSPSSGVAEMTVTEIVNGKENEFPGLINLIFQYLDDAEVDVDTRCTITQYLNFISKRASGEIPTLAKWIRNFVGKHPKYNHDSEVCDEIIYDLLKTMDDISNEKEHCEKLLGSFRSKTVPMIPRSILKAEEDLVIQVLKRMC